MATTRRYSVIGRCRVPLSAHSHQLNPVSNKNVGDKNFSRHVIKNETSMSPQEKTSKSYLCTPDIYTKERSLCPILRPQVSKSPILFPWNFLYVNLFVWKLRSTSLRVQFSLPFVNLLGKTSIRSRRVTHQKAYGVQIAKDKNLWTKKIAKRCTTLPKK